MHSSTGQRELWHALLWLLPAAPLAGLVSSLVAPANAGGSALLTMAGWLFVMPLLAGACRAVPTSRPAQRWRRQVAATLALVVSQLGG